MEFDFVIADLGPSKVSPPDTEGNASGESEIFFVERRLQPRFLAMTMPSDWITRDDIGGEFQDEFLYEERIRKFEDWPAPAGPEGYIDPLAGVSSALWDRDNPGGCAVVTHLPDGTDSATLRTLLEPNCETFIRFNEAVPILQKVLSQMYSPKRQQVMADLVCTSTTSAPATLQGKWRVMVSRNGEDRRPGSSYCGPVIGSLSCVVSRDEASEDTVLIAPFDSRSEAESVASYLRCRFTRFLILLARSNGYLSKTDFRFVPQQKWDRQWTDEALYAQYYLDEAESAYIERMISPWE